MVGDAVLPRPIPARRMASVNSFRRLEQIWYVIFHVSGCCQISRGVCSSPRSERSFSGKSSSVRNGLPTELLPTKDTVVYYTAWSVEKVSKEKEICIARKR